jgi:hypothetical protein
MTGMKICAVVCINTYSNRPYLLHKYTEGSCGVSSRRGRIMYGYPLSQQILGLLQQTWRIVKVSSLIKIKDNLIRTAVFLDVALRKLSGTRMLTPSSGHKSTAYPEDADSRVYRLPLDDKHTLTCKIPEWMCAVGPPWARSTRTPGS